MHHAGCERTSETETQVNTSKISLARIKKDPRPSRQPVNDIQHIITWCHSSVVNHEQMGRCDCHINNVLQSIIWGTLVITALVMWHGRRLKVSYDLSWITDRPNNLLRLEDTPHCILKYSFSVSTWPERKGREDSTSLLLTFISLLWLMSHMPPVSPWSPISVSFCLLTNFISSDKTTVDKLWSCLFKPFR